MRASNFQRWLACLLLTGGCMVVVATTPAHAEVIDIEQLAAVEVPHFPGDVVRENNDLVPHLAWLEDPSGDLDLAAVRSAGQWRSVQGIAFQPGPSRSAFWMQVRLSNVASRSRAVVVHFGGARQDYLDWYVVTPDGATVSRGRMGDRLPMGVRTLPTRVMAVPVTLPPKARVHLLVRASSHDGWNHAFLPVLASEETFLSALQRGDHMRGILFGALFTFGLLGFWGYIATRNRSGLYFAVYAVAGVGFSMADMAYDLAYLWPSHPIWHKQFQFYSVMVCVVAYAAFVLSFLEVRRHAPLWVTRVLQVMMGLSVVSVAPVMFDHTLLAVRTTLILPLLAVVASCVALWLAVRRVRGALFVVLGFAFTVALSGLLVLRYMKVIGSLPFDQGAAALGTGVNILFIAIGLARSLQHWRMERLKALLETEQAQAALLAKDAYEQRHDRLTGLPNRVALDEWLADRVQDPRPFALLHLGLRGFKATVEQHGETVADQALLETARRCQTQAGTHDFLAHTLDDEFVLALHGADATQAMSLASVLVSNLDQPVVMDSATLMLKPRIGIAAWPTDAADATALRQCAMLALQEAQEAPYASGAVMCYRQGSDQARMRRNTLLRHMLRAAEAGQLQLHYQPKLDVRTQRVQGAEALLRWQHPELGAVSPVEFIALAERAGHMHELTLWVLARAVRQIAQWRADGLALGLSVNLSVLDLQHRSLPEQVQQLLEAHGVPAQALTLEVTESSALHESDTVRRVLGELQLLGLALSMDDFGTGYSSLSTLQNLPLAELKIDQSFVRPLMEEDGENRYAAIVRATTDMGHAMGLRVVCEGVETAGVAQRLADWGCDELQGYWLSRPLPAERFSAWLRDSGRWQAPLSPGLV